MGYLSIYRDFFGKLLMLKLSNDWCILVKIPWDFNKIESAELSVENGDIYIDIVYDNGDDVINIHEWCDILNINYDEIFELLKNITVEKQEAVV